MATSDSHSHKEVKTDPSTIKKESGKEDEDEQLVPSFTNLKIKDSLPSKREDIRVRFLINVPVGVTPEMSSNAESHCQKFLDLLQRTAFKQEDKHRIEDIAVVFGLNGKESEKANIRREFDKNVNSEISFKKLGFMCGEMKEIPYRKIREHIKESERNKELVRNFREHNPEVRIYFCFFDADTVDFNKVLSSYIDVVKDHNYPTVMSTGYLLPKNSKERDESEHDRQVRIITAKHFPLGTHYPEPNFCVLLPDNHETLPERFDDSKDKLKEKLWNMESPVLIRQVKKRDGFSAVFANKNPIITPVSRHKQFHTNRSTWAISAYAHQELKVTERYKQETFGKEYEKDKRKANRSYKPLLMNLVKSDEEALRVKRIDPFEGPGAGQVFQAAASVRKYRNRIGLVTEEQEELGDPEEIGDEGYQEDPVKLIDLEEISDQEQPGDPEEKEATEELDDTEEIRHTEEKRNTEEKRDPEQLRNTEELRVQEEVRDADELGNQEELRETEEKRGPEELGDTKEPRDLKEPGESRE